VRITSDELDRPRVFDVRQRQLEGRGSEGGRLYFAVAFDRDKIEVGVAPVTDLPADRDKEVVFGLAFEEERHRGVLEGSEVVEPVEHESHGPSSLGR
jgi:hypothetical protein